MSDKPFTRPQMTEDEVNRGKELLSMMLDERLEEKGWGAFVSSHEIFGIMQEEWVELTEAITLNRADRVVAELIDIAVAAVFGAACIIAAKVDS